MNCFTTRSFGAIEDICFRDAQHFSIAHKGPACYENIRNVAGVSEKHELMDRHEARHQVGRRHFDRRDVSKLPCFKRSQIMFAPDRPGGIDSDHGEKLSGREKEGIVRDRLLE